MQHEQSFADIFNSFMRAKARHYGCKFHSFSLDGQDRDVGADYVITDSDRFAIIEFKYSQTDLVSEKNKPRRLKLCKKLLSCGDMRALHDKCHFISWAEGSSRAVKINIYRHEICTQEVFGDTCGLSEQTSNPATRATAEVFATKFFQTTGSMSLSKPEFESYVNWVITDARSSTDTALELMAYNPESKDLALVRLNSISAAQEWVKTNVSPPSRVGHSRKIKGK